MLDYLDAVREQRTGINRASMGLDADKLQSTTAIAVQARAGETPLPLLRRVSWSVLLLVAGLFVMVEALSRTGVIGALDQ